jgi:hypothetical protein
MHRKLEAVDEQVLQHRMELLVGGPGGNLGIDVKLLGSHPLGPHDLKGIHGVRHGDKV